jgi:hypothetical protein
MNEENLPMVKIGWLQCCCVVYQGSESRRDCARVLCGQGVLDAMCKGADSNISFVVNYHEFVCLFSCDICKTACGGFFRHAQTPSRASFRSLRFLNLVGKWHHICQLKPVTLSSPISNIGKSHNR